MADTDTASANKAYFNKLAAEYDARYEKTMLQLEREVRTRKDFIGADWVVDDEEDEDDGGEGGSEDEAAHLPAADGKRVRLLDYACGTGLISRALSQFTTHCVGIDISENMVAVYNARAENQGLRTDEMHAYQGDLTDPATFSASFDPNGRFRDFDVAGVGLGFHHFSDPELSARRIVERLRPGGVFFILDFLPHGAADAALPAASTVMHHGFSEERMRAVFEQAGAGKDFALEELGSGIVLGGRQGDGHGHGHTHDDRHGHGHGHGHGEREMGMKRRVFLARGTKV
ncbi:methyltransferase domain-containing protein [Colletotrichum navitas]|uniref:Methyltransferase domain-containing protein n=1 Tax=Colletotrichum navitas TaxID=681940 RepID=A0AAD8PT99_9PEZI|nr:methyltransferase domain-containing protein [Colletotrichum navitas]KAK1580321.1 methyltransferase domain-containing protein [Colletotrichum navitas]